MKNIICIYVNKNIKLCYNDLYMCGISGIIDISKNIVDDLYKSLFYLQHRGQQSSGFIFFSTAAS